MSHSFWELKRSNIQDGAYSSLPVSLPKSNETPKRLANLILKAPPESHEDPEIGNSLVKYIGFEKFNPVDQPNESPFQKCLQKKAHFELCQVLQSKEDQDLRVKGKLSKKGKRDGQNIRTYARYDSVIQALQQELSIYKIVPSSEDKKLLDLFEMKSKRSLQRFFFYLLLAKRQNKLKLLLPRLKLKVRAKIQQKGGHRTQQFLLSLQNCIQKYLDAAEKLQQACSLQQAKAAFSIAYLSDISQNKNQRKPHHNKIKGIDKCLQIYQIIMEGRQDLTITHLLKDKTGQIKVQPSVNQNNFLETLKIQNIMKISKQQEEAQRGQQSAKLPKKKQVKYQDESYSVVQSELLLNPNEKRKKIGVKNKKQDDRDIQKYAKFDIVSESSLQFLKIQKLHKSIPEICKKLSQRSLHFFFVILALIQKQKKDSQFLNHLELNYQRKVQKRYSQRSQYFRERLHKSFFNLIQATRKLFQGNLDEALDIAYEVRSQKKTHPAKASQQKKCRQIYQAIRLTLQGKGQQSKIKLQILIQSDKGHRSQLIKQLKCPNVKFISEPAVRNTSSIQISGSKMQQQAEQRQEQEMVLYPDTKNFQLIMRQPTGIVIPIPQRLNQSIDTETRYSPRIQNNC